MCEDFMRKLGAQDTIKEEVLDEVLFRCGCGHDMFFHWKTHGMCHNDCDCEAFGNEYWEKVGQTHKERVEPKQR